MMPGCLLAAPTRTADEIRDLDAIDGALRRIAMSIGAVETGYSTLIASDVLRRADYLEAFPHLLMSATSRRDRMAAGGDDQLPAWCLSPAVCYHTYAQLAGRSVAGGWVTTARGRCFRAEEQTEPGIRQVEFEMREIVLLGDSDRVDGWVEHLRTAVEQAAVAAGLAGTWEPAEDPFFLPSAAGKALMQRLMKVKLEYRLTHPEGLALASVNRHGSFFAQRFDIRTASGGIATTACVAIGLDRWRSAAALAGVPPAAAAQMKETR
jgi:seryl-tRNA synthetase